jgi:hypothetical protein
VNLNKKIELNLFETLANQAEFIGAYFAPTAPYGPDRLAKKAQNLQEL